MIFIRESLFCCLLLSLRDPMHTLQFPLVFVDTEYTTFWPTRETWRTQPHHHKEIVQIAAVKVNSLLSDEHEYFDQKIIPTKNPQLTKLFIDLTGLTQEIVNNEWISFIQALTQFEEFTKGCSICTFDKDRYVFAQNCELNSVDNPFAWNEFFRIKWQLPKRGIDSEKYSSGTLYKSIWLNLQWHVHNALHDVISMSLFTKEMLKKDW